MGPSASPANGGAIRIPAVLATPATSAITIASRTRRDAASGCSAPASTSPISRPAGSSTGSSREPAHAPLHEPAHLHSACIFQAHDVAKRGFTTKDTKDTKVISVRFARKNLLRVLVSFVVLSLLTP